MTRLASNSRLTNAAAVRVLPVSVAYPPVACAVREKPRRTGHAGRNPGALSHRVGADHATLDDRVGGRVTPPVRPHHRAYGSVHGGSSAPLQIPELSQKVQESPHRKQAIVHGRMHVRGPRVPPGARPVAVALRARAASSPFKAVRRFSLRSTSSSNVWVCGPIVSVLAGAV